MSWNPEIKKWIILRGRIIRVRHKGVQWGPVFDFIKQLTLKVRREKNHHVFPCFLRQKHFRAVIRHAQGSSPWGASIQRLALAIEVPQQSWWWEQALSVSKYGEIFARKYLLVEWEILLKILWAAMKEGLRWGGATFGSRNVPSSHLISLCTLLYHHHHQHNHNHIHNHHYHHHPAGRILVTNLELAEKKRDFGVMDVYWKYIMTIILVFLEP